MARFAGVELTEQTMQKTREHFAANIDGQVVEIESGAIKLPSHNPKEQHFAWLSERKAAGLAGANDYTLTFLQRAHWIQTGEMIALLPA